MHPRRTKWSMAADSTDKDIGCWTNDDSLDYLALSDILLLDCRCRSRPCTHIKWDGLPKSNLGQSPRSSSNDSLSFWSGKLSNPARMLIQPIFLIISSIFIRQCLSFICVTSVIVEVEMHCWRKKKVAAARGVCTVWSSTEFIWLFMPDLSKSTILCFSIRPDYNVPHQREQQVDLVHWWKTRVTRKTTKNRRKE